MLPAGWHVRSFDILWNEIYYGVRKKSTFTSLGAYEIFHLPPEPVLCTFLFGMRSSSSKAEGTCSCMRLKVSSILKTKAIPLQAWTSPSGCRWFRLPEFIDIRHMKVVRLSAVCTCRLYSPGDIPGTCFC